MNSSKEDSKFVAETLGAFGLEVAKTNIAYYRQEISREEYIQRSKEQLVKYGTILLEWKGDRMETSSKKYSWSYYDEDAGCWHHNVAYFEPPTYYDTMEQAEQAAWQFLRDNPHVEMVKFTEHDL